MYVPPYRLDELRVAYQCHVYYRWHTHYRRSIPELRLLATEHLIGTHPEIHLLNLEPTDREIALLASFRPSESVTSGAGKLKGAASKSLRQLLGLSHPEKLLGGGYFACTTGAATADQLHRYLDQQGIHHGYGGVINPPVFLQSWPLTDRDIESLQAVHAVTHLRWHFVFSTWDRKGVFTRAAAQAVTEDWRELAASQQVRFIKVSWVADHVHLALAAHPSVVPEQLVTLLLNRSQDLMVGRFDHLVIQAGSPRMWCPGAYVGTYGDLANAQIQAYLKRWLA